ncbi:MAG: hypothetical protein HYV07_28850 [Deltaproteobacteria bacterium]|nr:hypothetical protein [Deltaproteobacteria bacterium]
MTFRVAALALTLLASSEAPGGERGNAYELALSRALPPGWQLSPAPAPLVALALGPPSEDGRVVLGVRKVDDPPDTIGLYSEIGRRELSAAVESRGGVLDVTSIASSQLSGVPEITTVLRGPVADSFEIRYLILPSRPALLVTLAGPKSIFATSRASVEKRIVAALLELQARGKH